MVRLIFLIAALLALIPTAVNAAPSQGDPACDLLALLPGKLWYTRETRQVMLDDQTTLTLSLCTSAQHDLTGHEKLDLLVTVLPHLARHAGVPLRGASERHIYLVDTEALHAKNVEGYVNRQGEMYLHYTSNPWTVTHEAAHYWANYLSFDAHEPWLAEAYAEYLTGIVMHEDLHRSDSSDLVSVGCDGLALRDWRNDLAAPNSCGYAVGAQVFQNLAKEVGENQLRATMQMLGERVAPITSWNLLVALELTSHQNLESIIDQQVFSAQDAAKLTRWNTFRAELFQLEAQVGTPDARWPSDTVKALNSYDIDLILFTAAPWVEKMLPLAETAMHIERRCQAMQLVCPALLDMLPANQQEMIARGDALAGMQRLLDAYTPLYNRATALKIGLPDSLTAAVAHAQPQAGSMISRMLGVLDHGVTTEARCRSLAATCPTEWRAAWSQGSADEADQQITRIDDLFTQAEHTEQICGGIAATCRHLWIGVFNTQPLSQTTALLSAMMQTVTKARTVEEQCDNLRAVCHFLWTAAFEANNLNEAGVILDQTEGLLQHAQPVERRCTDLHIRDACRTAWARVLLQNQHAGMDPRPALDRARVAIDDLNEQLTSAEAFEEQCQAAGWPCSGSWHSALEQGGTTQLARFLADANVMLSELTQMQDTMTTEDGAMRNARLNGMQTAWASGDLAHLQVHVEAMRRQQYEQIVRYVLGIVSLILLVASIIGLSVFGWKRLRLRRLAVRLPTQAPPLQPKRRETAPAVKTEQPPTVVRQEDQLLNELLERAAGEV
ncbi:MAG TPA: hypothetical protein VFT66_20310 [Roseiflexaceae bacterium]|jgi:hypothetical protein|nr:hypothetical protein [Roseiflexaceae bacterium]